MSNLEIIDLLCTITSNQADLIKELFTEMEHNKQISDEMKKQYKSKVNHINKKLDIAEYHCRRIINTDDIEKNN